MLWGPSQSHKRTQGGRSELGAETRFAPGLRNDPGAWGQLSVFLPEVSALLIYAWKSEYRAPRTTLDHPRIFSF